MARDIPDTFPQLVDQGLRMLLQLLTSWKNAPPTPPRRDGDSTQRAIIHGQVYQFK